MRRKRRCGDCQKPLGGTTGACYKCGGEKSSPSREGRLRDAVWWKLRLGVEYETIVEAHDRS